MKFTHLLTIACVTVAASATVASAEELRIGFLNTTTGSGALIGTEMERGFKLGLEHQGWNKDGDKLSGVPTKVYYADDQARAEVGVSHVRRFLEQDKVQVVAGVIWSHVMMAIMKPVIDAKVMLVSANAGPSPIAGALCDPLFVSASFVNDQAAEATGMLVERDKVKSVVAMAPNYQAGKDVIAGFERNYKSGKVAQQILFKLGESDYQAYITEIRSLKPEAVFVFAPGAMGVSFVKQWVASGINKDVKLYAMWTISHETLPAIGDAAIGAIMADYWNPDLDNPKNKKFIGDYIAKHKQHPSHFAMTSYDAAGVIGAGVKATDGKLGDMAAVARAIRKGTFESARGNLKFNVNGFPIQPFWKLDVVRGPDGKPLIRGLDKIVEQPDSYAEKCPADKRL